MMRRLVVISRCICLAAGLLLSSPLSAAANDDDPYSVNIEQNLATPAVNAKHSAVVANAMGLLTRTLRQAGFETQGVRKGEVTMVTIPCRDLFGPNSIEIKAKGKQLLSKLVPYIKRSDKYKVVMAVHADDTGDAIYAERITSDRANAIDEYFASALGGESPVIPYGLGNDEPVAPNTGVANREKNRRVEIYFVPTKDFIDNARKKK
ncbi:MAG: OmpA family protein [Muribaculaceae bacterium]